MDVNTRNRADLKAFFVKNSIPTQSNFADLIDGMLNQKDDGFVKAKNLPLSIEAADPGVADSEKKAVTIYQSFADPNPAWTLSLNPRTAPNDPKTAKLGFAISDGEGTNRLFIDRNSGNVGIGTTVPKGKLEVATGGAGAWNKLVINTTNLWGDGNTQYVTIGEGGAAGIMFYNPHVVWYDSEKRASIRMGRSGGVASGHWWDIGVRAGNMFSIVDGQTNVTGLAISETGNVGIGTMTPGAKLEINATTSTHGGWLEAIRFTRTEHSAITLPAAGLLFGLHSDRNFYFADIKDGFKKYVMGINAESGNVGIGINPNPEKRLHIEAGELRVRASHNNTTADIGAFFAQNLTQGIGIGWNRIQAIGSNAAQDIQIIAKGAAGVFLKTGGDRYVVMQADGNLVIYDGAGRAFWSSGTNISDIRVKENIHVIDDALAKVLQLRGVSFSWKDKTMGGNEEIGLVAQEVETVMPYLVHSVDQKTKMVRYEKCVPLLVEAIKEQQAKIEQLRAEIQLLKT